MEELNGSDPAKRGVERAEEYPQSIDGTQVRPEVVAISTSAGGYLVDEPDVKPVEMKEPEQVA